MNEHDSYIERDDRGDISSRSWRRSSRLKRRRRLQAIAVLPSLFTLGNLLAGFAAIYFAAKPATDDEAISSLTFAGMLIFIGMFFDAVDGYVARLTHSASEMGGQLDSLSDIVTFGVAPAYMTLQLVSRYYIGADGEQTAVISPLHSDAFARVFWVCAAIYVSCTALRLARFNVETDSGILDDHLYFRGLPTPGAAGCVAGLILLHQHHLELLDYLWMARTTGLGMIFILLLCGMAMVSRLPYVHVPNRYLRGHASFSSIVKFAIILVCTAFYPHEALAIGFTGYTLSAPIRYLTRLWRRQAAVSSQRSAISNQQSAVGNQQSAISSQQSAISDQRSETSAE